MIDNNHPPHAWTLPRRRLLAGAGAALLPTAALAATARRHGGLFNIRDFGARGDGKTLDTAAIQRAIDAAGSGGGTVFFPRGRYLSFSVHLKSHVAIEFGPGAVLVAADPKQHNGHYDLPEPNPWDAYEDFGHAHFHNSLIWGVGIEDISITGPGLIDGEGLTRVSPNAPWTVGIGRGLPETPELKARIAEHNRHVASMNGLGNKAIALKNVRNVTLKDFSILRAGHFGILATGVDNLTIENLIIDTNRDGMDLDVVRNAHLSNLSVNSPYDDGIVLKSSLALGEVRPTENVTITNCFVSGYDVGTFLDGTYKRSQLKDISQHRTSGRIKLGTESNGGFRNIAVSNCVFDCCNGLAIESVDGGVLEDVVVDNLVMRNTTYGPIFLRLGDRRRAPAGTPMAQLRRVSVTNIDCHAVDGRYGSIVAGVPGGIIEDVSFSDLRLVYPGGGTAAEAAIKPPENAGGYPEPDMFGVMPAWGFYLRHVNGVSFNNVEMSTLSPDGRPAYAADDAAAVRASDFYASAGPGVPYAPVKV